jgi:hypothetical protein
VYGPSNAPQTNNQEKNNGNSLSEMQPQQQATPNQQQPGNGQQMLMEAIKKIQAHRGMM